MKNLKKRLISLVSVFMTAVLIAGATGVTAVAEDDPAPVEAVETLEAVSGAAETELPEETITAGSEETSAVQEKEETAPAETEEAVSVPAEETTAAMTEKAAEESLETTPEETAAEETASAESTEVETEESSAAEESVETAVSTEETAETEAEEESSAVVVPVEINSEEEVISYDNKLTSIESEEAEVPEIKTIDVTADGIKISWNAVSNASTYRVYRKVNEESDWSGYAWVKGTATSFTDKNISAGNYYSYTLRALFEDGKVSRYKEPGVTSSPIKDTSVWTVETTEPVCVFTGEELEPKIIVKEGDKVLSEGTQFRVEYEENTDPGTATATVYGVGEYRGSTDINFEIQMKTPEIAGAWVEGSLVVVAWKQVPGAAFYRIYYREANTSKWSKLGDAGSDQTEFYTGDLMPGTTYEFNVRSFHLNGQYSPISEKPSERVKFSKPVLRKVDDTWWLFGANGEIDYSYYGAFTDEDGTFEIEGGELVSTFTGDRLDMYLEAQNYSSATYNLILINRTTHRVGIYERRNDKWEEDRYIWCGDGAYETPTVEGVFQINHQWIYFDSDNARLFYASNFYGAYWIHSILFEQDPTPQRVLDGRLGMAVSHGCVRVSLENAQYIYYNCDVGTTVVVYH